MLLRSTCCLLLLTCLACHPAEAPADSPLFYFPTTRQLQKGIINKYYLHYQSRDGFDKSTDIRYYDYQCPTSEELQLTSYDPGYQVLRESNWTVANQQILASASTFYWRGDTFEVKIISPTLQDWQQDQALFQSTTDYGEGTMESIEWQQTKVRDSLVLDRPAKVFHQLRKRAYQYADQADRVYHDTVTNVYVQGLGLFESQWKMDKGISKLELVKQYNRKDFQALMRAAPKRVAHIDPKTRLDQKSDFSPCFAENKIHDYYNARPPAGYRSGKRGLEQVFAQQLDSTYLFQESGFLTFRFIINCNGEVGWITTEQADLNYQAKQFPPATIEHILKILQSLDHWRPAVIHQQATDAYTYLTLKLHNGQLIDILP